MVLVVSSQLPVLTSAQLRRCAWGECGTLDAVHSTALDVQRHCSPAKGSFLLLKATISYLPEVPSSTLALVTCRQPTACVVTAAGVLLQGGESLIGDSAGIAAAMPDSVLQRFADHGGVRYTRRYAASARRTVMCLAR